MKAFLLLAGLIMLVNCGCYDCRKEYFVPINYKPLSAPKYPAYQPSEVQAKAYQQPNEEVMVGKDPQVVYIDADQKPQVKKMPNYQRETSQSSTPEVIEETSSETEKVEEIIPVESEQIVEEKPVESEEILKETAAESDKAAEEKPEEVFEDLEVDDDYKELEE